MVNWLVGHIISPFMGLVLKVFAKLAQWKETSASKVPHFLWQGVGQDLIIVTHEDEDLPWYEWIFYIFIRRLYKLGDIEQKTFVAKTIGRFWDYVLNNSECYMLPSCTMDIFFVMPSALKEERTATKFDADLAFHVRVAQRIRRTLAEKSRSSTASASSGRTKTTVASSAGGISTDENNMRSTTMEGEAANERSTTTDVPSRSRSTSARKSRWRTKRSTSAGSRDSNFVSRESHFIRKESSGIGKRSTSREPGQMTAFSYARGLPGNTNSGEELNAALLFMQRLSKQEVHQFLVEALHKEEENEAAETGAPRGCQVSV